MLMNTFAGNSVSNLATAGLPLCFYSINKKKKTFKGASINMQTTQKNNDK